jgi:hypothetical protein
MKVRYAYPTNVRDRRKEIIIQKICDLVEQKIKLPGSIVVEFKYLGDHIYAETLIHPSIRNRILLNHNLNVKELIKPTIHELIHLSQMYTGQLRMGIRGHYIWEGDSYRHPIDQKLSYKDYQNLPWEADVSHRETELLNYVLSNY